MADLDFFKHINDTHGHANGDIVLKRIVEYMKGNLRPYDALFRYGGEEFLFCLPNTDALQGKGLLDRIRSDLENLPIKLSNNKIISITISMGITCLNPEIGIEDSIIRADEALYEAKKVANQYYVDGTKNNIPAIKCRECLAEFGYDHEKLFFHGLGHSLGFEAHDVGMRISHLVPDIFILKENMVYTNEPGLYWQGEWGIRLEDDVIIGKSKCEQVTNVPIEPVLI